LELYDCAGSRCFGRSWKDEYRIFLPASSAGYGRFQGWSLHADSNRLHTSRAGISRTGQYDLLSAGTAHMDAYYNDRHHRHHAFGHFTRPEFSGNVSTPLPGRFPPGLFQIQDTGILLWDS
jgi:hypothetical protein